MGKFIARLEVSHTHRPGELTPGAIRDGSFAVKALVRDIEACLAVR